VKDSAKKEITKETDGHRLCQRMKQLDYGRNTLGYERYLETVPKCVFILEGDKQVAFSVFRSGHSTVAVT
jgi:hypothetical protein